MDKEDIRTLAADPNLIKGIYNYCDRWCERCPFTSRCLNFTISNQQFADPETQDVSNEAFWQKLSETFQMTLDMVKEMAEREGIDLDSLDIEEDAEQERLKEESTENDRCCRAAKVYAETVEDWFDSARDLFGQEENASNIEAQLEIPDVSPLENDTSFEEATHVIRWYQHQIYVKLMRAIRGQLEEKEEILDEFAKDSDGSAKVALIAIDRSIAAWGEIRNLIPLFSKAILDMLVHLERLCKEVEKAFPAAREFIRPGFDKIDLNS